jgi:hypothetical protein
MVSESGRKGNVDASTPAALCTPGVGQGAQKDIEDRKSIRKLRHLPSGEAAGILCLLIRRSETAQYYLVR